MAFEKFNPKGNNLKYQILTERIHEAVQRAMDLATGASDSSGPIVFKTVADILKILKEESWT